MSAYRSIIDKFCLESRLLINRQKATHYHLAKCNGLSDTEASLTACLTGSTLLKRAAKLTFSEKGYSALSSDILDRIGTVMTNLIE